MYVSQIEVDKKDFEAGVLKVSALEEGQISAPEEESRKT